MRPGPGPAAVTVAIAGIEFGWGSSGKLSAVLTALRERSARPLRFVGLASGLGRPLLAGQPVERWYDLPDDPGGARAAVGAVARDEEVRAALVVLDGAAAKALEGAGVPTVFVDSLPFLWTDGDRDALPLEVSAYCAQRCPELPDACRGVLDAVRALLWVEAVIGSAGPGPWPQRRHGPRPGGTALVNLGGLRAPGLADWTRYPGIVVPAALAALAAYGTREVHVAGNLPPELVERQAAMFHVKRAAGAGGPPMAVTAGPLPHREFLARLAGCEVLLTSPGLTTLLEAGSLGVPTVCLPPQNLSQIFNGRFHSRAVGAAVRTTWPASVVSEETALERRTGGEDAALRVVYDGIAAAYGDRGAAAGGGPDGPRPEVVAAVRDGILTALRTAGRGADWGGLARCVGTGGAAQVADALLAILTREPLPAAPARP
ncbi:hydroxymethylcytosylglucuronate/cytosylglucuronate synthase [Streptomyces sp. RS10V-4]|uniref:hydroxymethylcytosylglucuronate/cytosylglucurona te synthase n=1 Tax=Streptomyces rhizoryzae TaxID=2932493 RepID=UPI00200309E9|nr:hydroxymethylcytosylglucuronate/cytosylglucuronate synthase [Streptomyces rhizoryzae]MCK7623761.1 hydroxymethylcytosylglucuronate/cytosylglucuronate synthase [Streptomyces rhizoryzae]